jgi:hypothetical protein
VKLGIGIPILTDHVPADFALSLAQLIGKIAVPYIIISPRGSIIPDARNAIADAAVENGCSHVLFLDSDMTVPVTTIMRLLGHTKPIVGAYGVKRKLPIERCGKPLEEWKPSGLIEMEVMGMAVTLISTEVFKRLSKPYFSWDYENGKSVSEDVYFCRKARNAGLKLWCDVDLSKEIGHVGTYTYRDN